MSSQKSLFLKIVALLVLVIFILGNVSAATYAAKTVNTKNFGKKKLKVPIKQNKLKVVPKKPVKKINKTIPRPVNQKNTSPNNSTKTPNNSTSLPTNQTGPIISNSTNNVTNSTNTTKSIKQSETTEEIQLINEEEQMPVFLEVTVAVIIAVIIILLWEYNPCC